MNKNHRRGAIVPLIAILLPVLLLLAGFAINIAHFQLTATEMQISTDAAARAAGRVYAKTNDETLALNAANEAGALNLVAGKALQFTSGDLELGASTRPDLSSRYEFSNGGTVNSIRVTGNRTSGSASGSIPIFFPNLMGRSDFDLSSQAVSTQVEIDLVLILDRSGSMAYADDEEAVYPPIPRAAPDGWDFGDPAPYDSRWLDVVAATQLLLNRFDASPLNETVGLTTYSNSGQVDVQVTTDYSKITNRLNDFTDSLEGGGTNIGDGLRAGHEALTSDETRPFAAKVALLMTDGRRTAGGNGLNWARAMAEGGMLLICVSFSDEADQGLMDQLAEAGNGFHVHAETAEDLATAFDDIAGKLPSLLTK